MSYLPNARPSPRISSGVLKWYHGDTFTLDIEFMPEDQDGEALSFASGDQIQIAFKKLSGSVVKQFEMTPDPTSNTVTLEFDASVSELFSKGRYVYDIFLLTANRRVTLAKENAVEVE